jgi:hypothetical protein
MYARTLFQEPFCDSSADAGCTAGYERNLLI